MVHDILEVPRPTTNARGKMVGVGSRVYVLTPDF